MPPTVDRYIISRDPSEARRLEFQHQCILSCQGYYLHPNIRSQLPANGARIAELATGTAIWLREFAAANPGAECHGFDISDKMFADPTEIPANVTLHVADMKQPFEERWLQYFDVVHIRLVFVTMKKVNDWAPLLQNVLTLLKPGGWIQWYEDDRPHSVRHAARPVAPLGAAERSLSLDSSVGGDSSYKPPTLPHLARYNRHILNNEQAEAMTFGYMNLSALMADPSVGNLEQVYCDTFVIDREDDGLELREGWVTMGKTAIRGLLQFKEEGGEKWLGSSFNDWEKHFDEDVANGAHFVTRAAVSIGRKRM